MKKTILFTFAMLMAVMLHAQNAKPTVYPGWYISLPSYDTVRTFSFGQFNLDSCKSRLLKFWGKPIRNTTGIIVWENLEIQGIGGGLKVILCDRLCTLTPDEMNCVTFKNERDKDEKLKNLMQNQSRDLSLSVNNSEDKDLIMDKHQVLLLVKYLEKILQ